MARFVPFSTVICVELYEKYLCFSINESGYNDVVDAIYGLIEIWILYSYLGRLQKFEIRQTVEQQV